MNTQAKVALDKQKHPERYCPVSRCLWHVTFRVLPIDLSKSDYIHMFKPDCPDGYCPRHQHLRPKESNP